MSLAMTRAKLWLIKSANANRTVHLNCPVRLRFRLRQVVHPAKKKLKRVKYVSKPALVLHSKIKIFKLAVWRNKLRGAIYEYYRYSTFLKESQCRDQNFEHVSNASGK